MDRLEAITEYSPLAVALARHVHKGLHCDRVFDLDDATSAAMFGLLDAADRFDESKLVRFGTYARLRIFGAIFDEYRNAIPVGRSGMDKVQRVQKAADRIQQRTKRKATRNEIESELDVDSEYLKDVAEHEDRLRVIGFDEPAESQFGRMPLSEIIPDLTVMDPRKQLDLEWLCGVVAGAIESLKEKDKTILALYYRDELTMEKIGEHFGITMSRISQWIKKSLERIREWLKKELNKEQYDEAQTFIRTNGCRYDGSHLAILFGREGADGNGDLYGDDQGASNL